MRGLAKWKAAVELTLGIAQRDQNGKQGRGWIPGALAHVYLSSQKRQQRQKDGWQKNT